MTKIFGPSAEVEIVELCFKSLWNQLDSSRDSVYPEIPLKSPKIP